ncbi:MAG: peptide chain release factor N(5)-glutamine methyltransferase [Oxalobacter sp.]|nr:peptide chain release factor N(5)-glutamine methyltransferase [Oxalobacter sp.]
MGAKEVIQGGVTVGTVLRLGLLPALELRILLEQATGISRMMQIAHPEKPLSSEQAQVLASLVQRRIQGEPIAYITGFKEFFGLPFKVTPDVLIPRPETELLVELALNVLPQGGGLLDMGTGSGAIAVAIAHERPDAQVVATDVSDGALAVARENAALNLEPNQAIRFLPGSWFDALEAGMRFDVIVSNPPYIEAGDVHLSQGDLRFEPQGALTDFADGLSALGILVDGAPKYLNENGWLLMEHGYNQSEAVVALLTKRGFSAVQTWPDLAGIGRVTGGQWQLSQ